MQANTINFFPRPGATRRRAARHAGFTLVEVLATLLLMGIALLAVMQAFGAVSAAATTSQRRAQAAALAESKLNEIVGTQQWNTGTLQGDFGTDQPNYTWNAEVNSWGQAVGVQANNVVQELDVHVMWKEGAKEQILTVSTLVYQSANTTSSTGTGSSTGATGGAS